MCLQVHIDRNNHFPHFFRQNLKLNSTNSAINNFPWVRCNILLQAFVAVVFIKTVIVTPTWITTWINMLEYDNIYLYILCFEVQGSLSVKYTINGQYCMYVLDAVSMQKPHKHSVVKCHTRAMSLTFIVEAILSAKPSIELVLFPTVPNCNWLCSKLSKKRFDMI